jgi:hypothetical protein
MVVVFLTLIVSPGPIFFYLLGIDWLAAPGNIVPLTTAKGFKRA